MRLVLTQVLHQKAILGTGVLLLHQFKLIFADKYIYFFLSCNSRTRQIYLFNLFFLVIFGGPEALFVFNLLCRPSEDSLQ
jgi:hypothetical protein